MKSIIFVLLSLWLCSCQRTNQTGPSVLVLAIEGLSGSNFSCNSYEDAERSGFQILCNEAVRFTHAFTPSPMAQAGLGAILTGEPPLYNGLRDNGQSFLSAKTVTLAEKVIERKTHTFFVVSAPTVKRYSRLHQGFENFNDDYDFSFRSLYRPASESFKIFKGWLDSEVNNEPYFAIVHISDLLFPQVITQTELLEPRPPGYEAQLEEIDENLYLLFNYLKEKNLWNKSYIVLTGLNGIPSYSRFNELPGTNLFAENVSVPLFIKPLKGREEIPHQWKVDVHVTLQDLGVTIEDILEVPPKVSRSGKFSGVSLLSLINGKSNPHFNKRPVMIESSWSQWALNLLPRYSVRDDQWLVIFDKKPLLYNALTDRNEMNRISLKESAYQATIDELAQLFGETTPMGYEKPDISLSEEFRVAQIIVENEGRSINSFFNELRPFIENNPGSETIQWLTLDQLLKQKKWDLIEELNTTWQNPLIEEFLSIKNGKPFSGERNPCLDLLPNHKTTGRVSQNKDCLNNDFLLLIDLLTAPPEKKDVFLDRFAMLARHQALQLKLLYFDLSKGGVAIGANTKKLKELLMFKMALGLPKFQKEISQVEKRMSL